MTQTQDEQNVQTSVSSTQDVNVVNTDTENTNQQMSVDSQDFQLEGFNNIEAQPAAPVAQPVAPEAQPTAPEAQPAAPVAQPAAPVAQQPTTETQPWDIQQPSVPAM